jgi:DNA-directed RNA polymerase subunit K/omega
MRVYTPLEVAKATETTANPTGSKYLGVLVAARYGRELNALPREAVPAGAEKKLTTQSLEALTNGSVDFELKQRRGRRL